MKTVLSVLSPIASVGMMLSPFLAMLFFYAGDTLSGLVIFLVFVWVDLSKSIHQITVALKKIGESL